MSFSFSGRHMEVAESLTDRASEACRALAEKYGKEFMDVGIVTTRDDRRFSCDISIKTSSGNSYYSKTDAGDPQVAFDAALQKVDRQMQKKSECRPRARSKADSRVEINVFDNSLEEKTPLIIAEILDDLPLLSVSDASKRLNDQTRAFVFENILNNSVNVVYIRADGNVGWVDYKK
jgi:ribosomal subunit interface protein